MCFVFVIVIVVVILVYVDLVLFFSLKVYVRYGVIFIFFYILIRELVSLVRVSIVGNIMYGWAF